MLGEKEAGFLGNSKYFIFSSLSYGEQHVYIVDTETGELKKLSHSLYQADAQIILGFYENLVVLENSSINLLPFCTAIQLDILSPTLDKLISSAKWAKFCDNYPFNHSEIDSHIQRTLSTTVKCKITSPNGHGFLYYSSNVTGPRPLLAVLHGGPHSAFTNSFMKSVALHLCKGYAVLGINYRGSAGYGQDYISSLLGHIGDYDVQDCIECIDLACSEHKEVVDINKLFITGGSHGGFLTTWLIAKYPKKFKAAISRNPACNLTDFIYTSDIPEWSFAEALNEGIHLPISEEKLIKLYKSSPVSLADKIETPLLLQLGGKDLRVPMSNGLLVYHVLKSLKREVELDLFPQDSHPLSEPETQVITTLRGLRWLEAVSYTHLTLPTILLVQISVVAVSLKKKKQINTSKQKIPFTKRQNNVNTK
eukprot:TRINITY_DN4644_c0_g1_i11.p1 TRINITY_DN4644_c0_g1~~TRINITY_DN4644_c0_g1_i11.p1  ORF type:complete len:422 (-),score=55.13 TRINITY_DN4644_c0_g1_i11:43-1308(-)